MNMDQIWAQLTIEERELLQTAPDQYVPTALVPRLQQLGVLQGAPPQRGPKIGARIQDSMHGLLHEMPAEFRRYVAEQAIE